MNQKLVKTTGAVLAAAVVLTGCGGNNEGSMPDPTVSGPIILKSLSNRADMISDGDAMVEVILPTGARTTDLKVAVGDRDVTNQFAVRSDGRVKGVVTGLPIGQTELTARLNGTPIGAKLSLTNTGRSGNIFAGTPIQPWICATKSAMTTLVTLAGTTLSGNATTRVSGLDSNPVDADCNAPTKFTYYYQPISLQGSTCTFDIKGTNSCFVEYAAESRPADTAIADFTNDRGVKVKSLLRVETGAMGRSIYQIGAFFDPAQPSTAFEPQKGWNQKVIWKFGASASGNRFAQHANAGATSVFDDNALRAGFLTVASQLTNHNDNNNEILAAENMMMIKEHIIDTYGEIRYTMSDGGSGGSTMQTVISSVMPGLLNGLQTGVSYDSTPTIWMEPRECGLFNQFFQTAAGQTLTPEQRAAIAGHPTAAHCQAWVNAFINPQRPDIATNCGASFPAGIVYDRVLRPNGVRCSIFDTMTPFIGTVQDTDGNIKPNLPYDNVGVQYGLKALQAGAITPEQFVALNEGVGSYTIDMGWTGDLITSPATPAARFRALPSTISVLHKSGAVSSPKNLAKVAIIDLRPELGADIHMAWRTFAVRARLDAANGHHDNHVVFASQGRSGPALGEKSFLLLDKWLSAIEKDQSTDSIEKKVVKNKPADAVDFCISTAGNTKAELVDIGFTSAACPVKDYASPRQVAGGPKGEDIFKCTLKPLDFSSSDYAGATFTNAQQERLRAALTNGVCDWSKPGQGVADWQPTTFKAGSGGQPLQNAPTSASL